MNLKTPKTQSMLLSIASVFAIAAIGCAESSENAEIVKAETAQTSAPQSNPNDADNDQNDTPKSSATSKRSQTTQAMKPKSQSTEQVVFEKKTIRDPGVKNIESHTLWIPKGWAMEGQTRWPNTNYFRVLPSPEIKITSPEGVEVNIHSTSLFSDPRPTQEMLSYGIQRPQEGHSDAGYPVLYCPDDLSEWKKNFAKKVIPQRRPNAKNIRVKTPTIDKEFTQALKASTQTIQQQVDQENRNARMMGMGDVSSLEVKGLVIEATYVEDGVRWEEVSVVGTIQTTSSMSGMTQIHWSVEPNFSFRAPKGELEGHLPELVTMIRSIRPTQEWTNMLYDHLRAMRKIDRRSVVASTNSVSKTLSEIGDIQKIGWDKRQAIRDEGNRKFSNYIQDVNDYSHNGTEYQLPSGYDHAYTNGTDDTVILTNDALFNPNVDLQDSNSWSTLERIR